MNLNQVWGVGRSLVIYYGRPWLRGRMRKLYAQFLKEGDLAFDIGSHVGNRILPWTDIGARVVAIEPQAHLFRFLKTVYGRHPQVTLLRAGIGANCGESPLYVSDATPTVTSFSKPWISSVQKDKRFREIHWNRREVVPMRTLDHLIVEYGRPAFCKIDVEGFELDVLQGLSQPLAALSFEFLPFEKKRALDCMARLEALAAYEYNWSFRETMLMARSRWLGVEEMKMEIGRMPSHLASGDIYARQL